MHSSNAAILDTNSCKDRNVRYRGSDSLVGELGDVLFNIDVHGDTIQDLELRYERVDHEYSRILGLPSIKLATIHNGNLLTVTTGGELLVNRLDINIELPHIKSLHSRGEFLAILDYNNDLIILGLLGDRVAQLNMIRGIRDISYSEDALNTPVEDSGYIILLTHGNIVLYGTLEELGNNTYKSKDLEGIIDHSDNSMVIYQDGIVMTFRILHGQLRGVEYGNEINIRKSSNVARYKRNIYAEGSDKSSILKISLFPGDPVEIETENAVRLLQIDNVLSNRDGGFTLNERRENNENRISVRGIELDDGSVIMFNNNIRWEPVVKLFNVNTPGRYTKPAVRPPRM